MSRCVRTKFIAKPFFKNLTLNSEDGEALFSASPPDWTLANLRYPNSQCSETETTGLKHLDNTGENQKKYEPFLSPFRTRTNHIWSYLQSIVNVHMFLPSLPVSTLRNNTSWIPASGAFITILLQQVPFTKH